MKAASFLPSGGCHLVKWGRYLAQWGPPYWLEGLPEQIVICKKVKARVEVRMGGGWSDSILKKSSHTGVQRMKHVGQRYEEQVRLVQVNSQDRKLNQ